MKYRTRVPMTCQLCRRSFSTIGGLHTHFRFNHIIVMTWMDYINTYIESFYDIDTNGCWVWKGSKDKYGYGRIKIHKNMTTGVHRMTFEYKYGKIPHNLEVLHSCDNPSCINPDHLWAGTQKDNMRDASIKGRICHGENHPWKRPEIRKKLSSANTGRRHTIESRIKMSKNNAMNDSKNRLKVSEALRGSKNYSSKPVIINDYYYDTLSSAGKALKVDPTTITYRIKHNKSGYRFAGEEKNDL